MKYHNTKTTDYSTNNNVKDNKHQVIALVGNPNVGKSVIFNYLTGSKVDVSNYPGTTIEIASGELYFKDKVFKVIDTPGVYGVSSYNDEELATLNGLKQADLVINVVSALSLDRDLFLTLQLRDFGLKMLVIVNQYDDAIERGLDIDFDELEKKLQLPVIKTIATRGIGLNDITTNIEKACSCNMTQFREQCEKLQQKFNLSRFESVLLLENDETIKTNLSLNNFDLSQLDYNLQDEVYTSRRLLANEIFKTCVSNKSPKANFTKNLGKVLIHPIWGGLTAFFICYLVFYQFLGVIIAQKLIDITEKRFMNIYYEPNVKYLFANFCPVEITVDSKKYCFANGITFSKHTSSQNFELPLNTAKENMTFNFWYYKTPLNILANILVGEYGILTLTVTYLFALLFPLVVAFYFALSIFEDSGYLPRLAVLVDQFLNKLGLNGRAIIPLILGLGCVTMATITTRLLTTKREKIIATALLGIAIPCSAQLGVVSGVLAKSGGFTAWIIYLFVVFSILGLSGLALNSILPGDSNGLIIDLPPMRFPRMNNVLSKTWNKSLAFLKESIPMFALASLAVTIAQMTGLLDIFIKLVSPITIDLLHLPNNSAVATTFILGVVRRDFASFGLAEIAMTQTQAIVCMIVITLFVPCIATVGVMIKERGFKVAMAIWTFSIMLAFAIGGILARILPIFLK